MSSDIVTAGRDMALVIPQRAVIFRGASKLVRVLDESGSMKEVNVETGLMGNRGLIEITSGVKEGDVVITAIKN